MKSLFYVVAAFSLALASCVQRIPEKEMPDVDNGAITMIKAAVEPLHLKVNGTTEVGHFQWNEAHSIGIYGSLQGVNELYLPVKTTVGGNEAYFYGNVVGGDLAIYMPYNGNGSEATLNGRVRIPAEQQYYATPLEHLMYNSTFMAMSTTSETSFGYHTGLVQIEIQYDIQDIESITLLVGNVSKDEDYDDYIIGDLSIDTDVEQLLTNGSDRLVVKGFPEGVDSTIANPLVLWASVAPGIYENFVVEIVSKDITITSPVKGPFVIEPRAVAKKVCVAKEVNLDNEIGDLEIENGNFNESK